MSQIISFPAGQIIDTHTPHESFGFLSFNLFLKKKDKNLRENLEENKPTKVHVYSFGVVLYEIIMGCSTIKPMDLRLKIFFWNGLNYIMLIAKALE